MAYFSEEKYDAETTEKIAAHVREILKLLGEDTEREGLLKTPERVAKAMQFMTKGYAQDGVEIIKSAIFDEEYQQMVLIKDIELYSSCEHHMLPFIGKAHVAYIQREDYRAEQDSQSGGDLCPQASGPGASYRSDQGLHPGGIESARSRSRDRGHACLHADQGSAEVQCGDDDFGIFRSVPYLGQDQERVSESNQVNSIP